MAFSACQKLEDDYRNIPARLKLRIRREKRNKKRKIDKREKSEKRSIEVVTVYE